MNFQKILFLILFLPVLVFPAYSASLNIGLKSVDFSYKNYSNYPRIESDKSENALIAGLKGSADYSDSFFSIAIPVFCSKEFNNKFDDNEILTISPSVKYDFKGINLFAGGFYDKNYEDFEEGVSNMKTELKKKGFHAGISSDIFANSDLEINFDFIDFDYDDLLFSDRTEKNISLILTNNFFGKTNIFFKTYITDVNYEKGNDFQDNKEYAVAAGFKGFLSDKTEGISEFAVQKKKYDSSTDSVKMLFNLGFNAYLSKKIALALNYKFDICENYLLEYDTTFTDDNRYYELSEYKLLLKYNINESSSLSFAAKFSRKNYADLTDVYPVDKLYDYVLEHSYKFDFKKFKFDLVSGIKYFTKDISPEIDGNYDGCDVYSKLTAYF